MPWQWPRMLTELGFSVNSHGEDVEGEDEDDEDGDPGCRSNGRPGVTVTTVPVPYDCRCSTKFGTLCEGIGVPLIPVCCQMELGIGCLLVEYSPANSKPQSRIRITSAHLRNRTWHRKPCYHFTLKKSC